MDEQLRELDLPSLGQAEGELGAAMSLSFVRYLVARGGKDAFLRMLASAQPGHLDAAAQQEYGASMAALEEGWRQKLAAGEPDMKTGQFLRLTVRYLRPHKRREIEMFVYMLLGLAFTVVYPFAFKNLLDKAIPSGEYSQVLKILAVLSAAFLVTAFSSVRGAYLSAVVSGSVVRQLRQEMFTKMQHLSQGWYNQHQQGDVLSRVFSDVGMLEQGLSQTLRGGLVQILTLAVSATVLVILNFWLALIVLAGAPIIALIYKAMSKGAQKRSIAVQEETGSVLTVASENYGAQAVVKAFGLQLREIGRFRQSSDRLFDRQVKLQLFGGLFGVSVQMVVTALQVFILGLGAWLIFHGHLTIGGLVAFMSLMGQALAPVTVLTGIGQQIQSSTGALVRINEVLEAEPEVVEKPDAGQLAPLQSSIELRHVGFSYTPERRTLDDVNVSITAGQRVAFVGPTGAGKSSVLQLLMRFYDPDEGGVFFDGVDIRDATVESLRRQLGVVFQETFLFNSTIAENIGLGNPNATDDADPGGGQGGRAPRLRDQPASGLRDAGGRTGRAAVGWATPTAVHRPGPAARSPGAGARRGHLRPRSPHRADDRRHARAGGPGPHHHRRDPPPDLHHRLRPDLRGGDRQGGRARHPRRPGGGRRACTPRCGPSRPEPWPPPRPRSTRPAPWLGSRCSAGSTRRVWPTSPPACGPSSWPPASACPKAVAAWPSSATAGPPCWRRTSPGSWRPLAEVGPGDAFGLSALLGEEKGYVLAAVDPLSLVVIDDEAVRGLAGVHPEIAQALEGTRRPAAGPAGGQRLSRLTMAPGNRMSIVSAPSGPTAEEVRRMTGSMPAVQQQ